MTEAPKQDTDHLVKQAKLAEQAERYDDMSDFMKDCVKQNEPLGVEVRILYFWIIPFALNKFTESPTIGENCNTKIYLQLKTFCERVLFFRKEKFKTDGN